MLGHQFVVKNSRVWHPNTQMSEWSGFDKITNAKGIIFMIHVVENSLM